MEVRTVAVIYTSFGSVFFFKSVSCSWIENLLTGGCWMRYTSLVVRLADEKALVVVLILSDLFAFKSTQV